MGAQESDSRTFFKTIKRQRSTKSTNTQLLHYKDEVLSGAEEVASGFASHFEALATPSEAPSLTLATGIRLLWTGS